MTDAQRRPCVHIVAGARPNFMKIAPMVRALQADGRLAWKIVHTGQHFDRNMSDVFFEELGIPAPDVHFNCGGGSHASQTARIMEAFEKHCADDRPDAVVVVGDVNSTLACAIVAKKAGIPVAHVEAGLRSGDMAMPEEINRLVTDSISDWFFVTEPSGVAHLKREGHPDARIFYVGHVMVDNVMYQARQIEGLDRSGYETQAIKAQLGSRYGVVTMHRPSNVDDLAVLGPIAGALKKVSEQLPLVFPVHPRTRGNLEKLGLELGPNIHLMSPQPYMSFLNLWKDATVVLTDSGGLQEETTALGVPCVTMRENTERPVTVDEGTNVLVGISPEKIVAAAIEVIEGRGKQGRRPHLWDGDAAVRIANDLARLLGAA
ncbi:UDP-N-acetylglucosamine 2-epimerase (non-hydrolyzing) [Ideonella sp. DXS22W]|uniref:UDP-N-acetylglucosamine 2-epimerase (Non-hydrolyzing) n=1 Tax=Pseudaquabacterium inlustre TaxID=2984192 RepID=A0ABU9CE30_9BURK